MSDRFDYFVVFAEMRTGSNFLESNLNAIDGLACHGEAFNAQFIGYPNKSEILGITQKMRDEDPLRLIGALRDEPGALRGFRFFHNHDPRALEIMLEDPRCAKVILTRNPLESYVSLKIARVTGQWKLTDVKRRKDAKAEFDADEFQTHVEQLQGFQEVLLNRLQRSGQAAFYLAYEDLQSVDVMNGLADWLGVRGRLEALDDALKPQNPQPISAKVVNPDGIETALAAIDTFNLTRTPNFEPRRGAAVPTYLACVDTSLMFLPMQGGPRHEVTDWMAALDNVEPSDLLNKMNQKQLRQWKRAHPGHRTFTVLRHPVARAHSVFCRRILNTGEGSYMQIRETLRKRFKLPIPGRESQKPWTIDDHRLGFAGFLTFVKMNLAGQTAIRVDAAWGTQAQNLSGFGDFVLPDYVVREDEMPKMLPLIAGLAGRETPLKPGVAQPETPFALADFYDQETEDMVAKIYQRDYMLFGFGSWA